MNTEKTAGALLAELSTVSDAVRNKEWSTGGLAGVPKPDDFGALISSANPLANLAAAGVGMLTPHVSFLAKPLDEFRGDSGAVSAPAQGMATAAADVRALADTFRQTGTTETSGWTGAAGDGHRITSAQFADGITAVAEAAKTIADAIVDAGEEVVKALTEIVRLIGQAVGEMVPVMADGIARAPLTMGLSIGEAITKCVAIATTYGGKVAEVMANLLANGMNLMKLVQMVLTIVHAVTQLLAKLAKLAESGDPAATKGTPAKPLERGEQPAAQYSPPTGDPGAPGAATPTGAKPTSSGTSGASADPPGGAGPATSLPAGTMSGTGQQSPLSTPSPAVGAPASSSSTGQSGGVPLGGVAPLAGAAPNTGSSGARSAGRLAPGGSVFARGPKEMTVGQPSATAADATPAGVPAGPMAMGTGARGQGADDTEHERRYPLAADGDAFAVDDEDVIVSSGVVGATPEQREEPTT